MRTIIEIDLIAKRATERIIKEFAELGFSNPPVVSHGVVRAVLEAAEQSVHLTGLCVCPEKWSVDIRGNCSNCGLAKSPRK